MSTLRERYGPLLELVRTLIGVVPNCDPYLEIWPNAFVTYNVMVPNFLNLPFLLFGRGARRDLVGLALYVSSRAAECAYCSAHCCSFALRRGAAPELIEHALDDGAPRSDAERAVVGVARALGRVPATLGTDERTMLAKQFSPAHVEWIVLAASMMGFLNKFMDALGVELEPETVAEVDAIMSPSGWSAGKHLDGVARPRTGPPPPDSLATKLGVLRYLPAALSFERSVTRGVPDRWPAVGELLRARTGHDFPVLGRLRHARAIRAIAVMLNVNLDARASVLGLSTKARVARVYARVVGSTVLTADVEALLARHGAAAPFADEPAVLALAETLSPSPAGTPSELGISAAAIVELVTWLSVLQMLHRLSSFYNS
jgi:alkylhydroperoxidase family enzyme